MLYFNNLSTQTFLTDFWQKKHLVIRNAIPDFINLLSPDELAGLSLEEDIESRMVYETPGHEPNWHFIKGPFTESHFSKLPKTHWTLLVQGVDRIIPEVYALLHHFDFIPPWRFDDVMISFATLHGSVGPHYDNYDVFLYQAKGRRKWLLTTKKCHPDNYISNLELRIMKEFEVEEEIILEEGDMLYLPPHVGHYGISLSDACMTYSFGYRSYPAQELWESFGDYLALHAPSKALYQDPNWSHLQNPSELTKPAWLNAQQVLRQLVNDEHLIQSWFGSFATHLDAEAEQQLPNPLEDDECLNLTDFIRELKTSAALERDAACRFAYQIDSHEKAYRFYINGNEWDTGGVSNELLSLVANQRTIPLQALEPYLSNQNNQLFLYELWKLQWLIIPG